MAPDPINSILDTVAALLVKFWSGILAALLSLRFVPASATFFDRAFALFGGVSLTIMFGPIVVQLTGMEGDGVVLGTGAVIGLFGFLIVGEVVQGIKQLEIGVMLRDLLRKWFRLGGGQ